LNNYFRPGHIPHPLSEFTCRLLRAGPKQWPDDQSPKIAHLANLFLRFSPDGNTFLAISYLPDGAINVDARNSALTLRVGDTQRERFNENSADLKRGYFLSPAGNFLLESDGATRSRVSKELSIQHVGGLTRGIFAPDQKHLATLHRGMQSVRLW